MSDLRTRPGLADTSVRSGIYPDALVARWLAVERDPAQADELLAPFGLRGILVSSDGGGLSRRSAEMDLIDLHAILSRSKQIIHAIGVAIGGRGIGRWVADNTAMLYPDDVDPGTLFAALAESRDRLVREGLVEMGFCAHRGEFYDVAGHLWGPDWTLTELLAEEHARPGEILVTAELVAGGSEERYGALQRRQDLSELHPPGVHSLQPAATVEDIVTAVGDEPYPHPYATGFFDALQRIAAGEDRAALVRRLEREYGRERTVVFARWLSGPTPRSSPAILDEMAAHGALTKLVRTVAEAHPGAHVVRADGGLAIVCFEAPDVALAYARAARAAARDASIPLAVGVDRGPLLLFAEPGEDAGIDGSPVNLASKLAEELGSAGTIQLTDEVARAIEELASEPRKSATISRMQIDYVAV